jgi:hypothetical protein
VQSADICKRIHDHDDFLLIGVKVTMLYPRIKLITDCSRIAVLARFDVQAYVVLLKR